MSVVAGCSLFNGVLLLADCRATVIRPGRPPVYVDNIQKIFAIPPSTALGYVGDIATAAALVRALPRHLQQRTISGKRSAVSLRLWLPRYFRYAYSRIRDRAGPLLFMVASVIPGRPNVIERAKAVALMERFRLGQLSHQRNWLPGVLVNILSTPAETKLVRLVDAPFGLLYAMKSPDFILHHLRPLEFAAIGSGESVITQIEQEADWIFAGDVGNPFSEAMGFRTCVSGFMERNSIPTVGGLFPCIRVDALGVHLRGHRAEIPIGGERIELVADSTGRWTQRHLNSRTEIRLRYPWEVDFSSFHESVTFDFLREAEARLHGT